MFGMACGDRTGSVGMELGCEKAEASSPVAEGINEESGRVGEKFCGR